MDKVIYTVCTLCRDHERSGFIEGIKVGICLAEELLEVCFDLVVVIGIPFIMTVVQHFQDGVRFAKVWRILLNMLFQNFKIGFHKHHTP